MIFSFQPINWDFLERAGLLGGPYIERKSCDLNPLECEQGGAVMGLLEQNTETLRRLWTQPS